MPLTKDKAPKVLPDAAKNVWIKAFNSAYDGTCKDRENRDECAAKIAWSAVKRGWHKVEDKWVPKSTVEFPMYINKAIIDNDTGEMRWQAVNSDTEPDLYDDEMTVELYSDFLRRIESKELPPEKFRSEFWSGGMPYLSISHYLDLNGKAVPGEVLSIFIDGNKLKSKGIFYDTELGKICYKAVRENFFTGKSDKNYQKVRISIAFIDWCHVHKSNGFEYVRKSLDEVCPQCIKEFLSSDPEEKKGKIFKQGQLIHLALTRSPVNERTIILEERSMVTQLEDAASIIGEEKAKEIDELSLTGKSLAHDDSPALVIKAEKKEKDEEDDMEEEEEKEEKKADLVETEKEEKADLSKEEEAHVLSAAVEEFLSVYNDVTKSNVPYTNKLEALQEAFVSFGEQVKSTIVPDKKDMELQELSEIKSLVHELSSQLKSLSGEIAILKQKQIAPEAPDLQRPVQRSLSLSDVEGLISNPARTNSKPMSVNDIAYRSVGL